MAGKKNPVKIEVLQRLEYEQIVSALRQFEDCHPTMRARKEFLGISISMEGGLMLIKITVTQLGEAAFVADMNFPKEFDANFENAKATLKVSVKSAPILTSAAPKSAAGKKTAPVFPVGQSRH